MPLASGITPCLSRRAPMLLDGLVSSVSSNHLGLTFDEFRSFSANGFANDSNSVKFVIPYPPLSVKSMIVELNQRSDDKHALGQNL